MGNDAVITVEGLSKRYTIGHEVRYNTLRDRLAKGAGSWWRRLRGADSAKAAQEEFWALSDVSFAVERGEVLGVVGSNGAGKSTLLKILSRITEPTSGTVRLRGRAASLLEVGTGFHPELTGRENILLNGAILGMRRQEIRAKFDEIVEFAEVKRFLDTPVKHYSSGMYVRLAFAIAAHLEPEILIIDEVLAVGDTAFQKKCLGKMRDVAHGEGRTVLFVSHNLPIVRQVCSRAILLERGRLKANGPTNLVLGTYAHGLEKGQIARIPEPTSEMREQAFVSAVCVETLDRRPLAFARVGEPWRVRIRFRAGRALSDFVIALGITTSENLGLQTVWSAPSSIEAGEHEVLFTQDAVALAADSYTLVVGLVVSDRTIQQFDAARLEITGEDPMTPCPAASGFGLIINSMRVELRRV
jgi:lipopolysaccharide transport system ATP-binding protein